MTNKAKDNFETNILADDILYTRHFDREGFMSIMFGVVTLQAIRCTGLRETDPRLRETYLNFKDVLQNLAEEGEIRTNASIDRETFCQ